MSLTYRIKSFVEVLEDYKVGLEEHLYGESGEQGKNISPDPIIGEEPDDDIPVLVWEYKLTREELLQIRDEIGRVRLFIDVFTKFLNEPLK